MAWNKLILGLLTLVSIGMIIGSLLQLEFIHRLEKPLGVFHWENDMEAAALHIGYVYTRRKKRTNTLDLGVKLEQPLDPGSRPSNQHIALRKGYKLKKWFQFILAFRMVKPEVISWSPRIILFHGFLSDEECEYLKALSRPRLEISTVVDAKTGKGVKSQVRTSSGMFLSSEERKHPIVQAGDGVCSCGGKRVSGVCVKPNKGVAVLFWSMGLNGESDMKSLHAGCPVLKGEKWSATKWMRQKAAY